MSGCDLSCYENDGGDCSLGRAKVRHKQTQLEKNVYSSTSLSDRTITFTKENWADYNNPENWDCITSNVCITRGDNQSIYNPLTDDGYDGSTPDGIEWAWGSTEEVLANGGIGIDGDRYTTDQEDFQREGPNNDCCETSYYLSDYNPNNVAWESNDVFP